MGCVPFSGPCRPLLPLVVLVVCEQAAGNSKGYRESTHSACINNANLIDALQVDFFLTSVELLEL